MGRKDNWLKFQQPCENRNNGTCSCGVCIGWRAQIPCSSNPQFLSFLTTALHNSGTLSSYLEPEIPLLSSSRAVHSAKCWRQWSENNKSTPSGLHLRQTQTSLYMAQRRHAFLLPRARILKAEMHSFGDYEE